MLAYDSRGMYSALGNLDCTTKFGFQVIGVTIRPFSSKRAEENNVSYIHLDLNDPDQLKSFANEWEGKVSVITSFMVLHSIPNIQPIINLFGNCLRPLGKLVVTVPAVIGNLALRQALYVIASDTEWGEHFSEEVLMARGTPRTANEWIWSKQPYLEKYGLMLQQTKEFKFKCFEQSEREIIGLWLESLNIHSAVIPALTEAYLKEYQKFRKSSEPLGVNIVRLFALRCPLQGFKFERHPPIRHRVVCWEGH